MVKLRPSGYIIHLRLLAMKRFDAIRPGHNCFISMTISVVPLCGFQALDSFGKVARQLFTAMATRNNHCIMLYELALESS